MACRRVKIKDIIPTPSTKQDTGQSGTSGTSGTSGGDAKLEGSKHAPIYKQILGCRIPLKRLISAANSCMTALLVV